MSTKHQQTAQPSELGTVISHFGAQIEVRNQHGQHFRCHAKRARFSLVAGDTVKFTPPSKQADGTITKVLKRQNVLERPDNFGKIKAIASNIDQAIIIFAPTPIPSSALLDSYLIACSQAKITPVLAFNKFDLSLSADERDFIENIISVYESIGYPIMRLSAEDNIVAPLADIMHNKKTVLVGQSGVGKSSLINQLIPDAAQSVKIISENSKLGQHTTTTARLFPLGEQADAGFLVDSPGIREFKLWHINPLTLDQHYREFQPFLGLCKFRNCQHKSEPQCRLKEAVSNKEIHPLRWENFNKLRESIETSELSLEPKY